MADILIATGVSNTTPDSTHEVSVASRKAIISVEINKFFDALPIIPASSKVEGGKVLYRLRLKFLVSQIVGGAAVVGFKLKIKSNRGDKDTLSVEGVTDDKGVAYAHVESRFSGELKVSSSDTDLIFSDFNITFKEAWFESPFLVTAYNVCDEADFSGEKVTANGLPGKYKTDFIFGVRGVPMQGTGKTSDGTYVRLQGANVKWSRNSKGVRTEVENKSEAQFAVATGVLGAYATLTDNVSIAVDPKIIPKRSKVLVSSVDGTRGLGSKTADDTGGGIRNFHIDNFLGSGQKVVDKWFKDGGDIDEAKIKFMGY